MLKTLMAVCVILGTVGLLAAEDRPPAPCVEPQTGLAFPTTLGPLHRASSLRTYDRLELGASIRYSDQAPTRADIYLYDWGKTGLGTGRLSAAVRSHFEGMKRGILAMQENGSYLDVRKLSDEETALETGAARVPMLHASYAYAEKDPTQENKCISHLFLSTYKDKFFKIRFTYLEDKRAQGEQALKAFLVDCGKLFTSPSAVSQGPREIQFDLGGRVMMEFVLIRPGSFLMGDAKARNADEKPAHKVSITKPFFLGKYEVTQQQWMAIMENNSSGFQGPKNPVEHLTWDDCQAFVAKVNAKLRNSGAKFSLPTEAQWEYACRAGGTTQYCCGDDEQGLLDYAWFEGNSGNKAHPVGQKKPNAWGLYDMHGNVSEWCADWHGKDYYGKSPAADPTGPAFGDARVLRGGNWRADAMLSRSACRNSSVPFMRSITYGFRVACLIPGETPTRGAYRDRTER